MNIFERYVDWLGRHARAVFAASLLAVAASVYLIAFHLPIRADFKHLLPDDAPAVRDLQRLEQRMPAKDTALVILVAPDAATRAAAGAALIAGLRAIGPHYVERLETDDAETRAFLRARRHLFVPLPDLIAARDALAKRIADAKLRANPLYIELDRDPEAERAEAKRFAELREKRREAEAKLDRSSFVSADGRTQLVIVRTSFLATDVPRDRELLAELEAVFARVRAAHPGIEIGVAGGIPSAVAEHDAIADGILRSSIVTAVLVALVLFVHLRTLRLIGVLGLQIVVATLISFGVAAIAVGHLNAATAFLGAIIAGNGVNYGILLVARYLEEHRTGDPAGALARAIAGTLRPTLVASLGASISYSALAVTRFRGFSDFALIGGIGMIVCWIVSYTLFPLLLLRYGSGTKVAKEAPIFGRFVARTFGFRSPAVVCAIAAAATVVAGLVTWRYIADDPFEYDMSRIRSDAPAAVEARRWLLVSNEAFGRGVIGRTYLAVDRPEQVEQVVAAIRNVQAETEHGRATIGRIQSILEVVPADQPKKLAVLADLRRLLDDPGLEELPDNDPSLPRPSGRGSETPDNGRAELRELRPPDELRAIEPAALPAELVEQFRELDGRIGLVIAIRPAATVDEWDGRSMIRFAAAMREVERLTGEHFAVSGTRLIFADILATNRADGPLVTAVAGLGLIVMVLFLVGPNRRGVAVLLGTGCGSLAMVAVCAMVGLKINFLDFVALPIALGLGIDYAINVAQRAEHDEPMVTLRTTGGTVLVCALTTMIGYSSLLLGDNHAIRDFGLASLIGEVTCVITALTLVVAVLAMRPRPVLESS